MKKLVAIVIVALMGVTLGGCDNLIDIEYLLTRSNVERYLDLAGRVPQYSVIDKHTNMIGNGEYAVDMLMGFSVQNAGVLAGNIEACIQEKSDAGAVCGWKKESDVVYVFYSAGNNYIIVEATFDTTTKEMFFKYSRSYSQQK
ncbi:hypothetical protein AGMMS49982_18280 [Bacteroidia bacterium]|nr:hypothetical protein AGMMS49982_18280 [Bacteroidia bacterium]